jgi:hypothetical protein
METTVKKTWMPTTAGILNIITGVLNALALIFLVIAIISFYSLNIRQFLPPGFVPPPGFHPIMIIFLLYAIISAALPIIGGVFALQRRKWGWALGGSIVAIIAILGTFPLGIASTIFVAIARDEFE